MLEWKLGADIRKYARVGEKPEPWRTSGRGNAKRYHHDKQRDVSYLVVERCVAVERELYEKEHTDKIVMCLQREKHQTKRGKSQRRLLRREELLM